MRNALSKLKNLSPNVRAVLVFGIASFATSGINYITTPVVTRLLSAGEYGIVSTYNAMYAIVSVIATLTLVRPGVLNVGLYEHPDSRWSYLSNMLGAIAAAVLVCSGMIALFWPWLSPLIKLPPSLVALMMLTCLLQPAVIFWTAKNRYEYQCRGVLLVTAGTALLSQCVSIAAILWASQIAGADLPVVRLWSAGAVNLAAAMILYIYVLRQGRTFVNLSLWKRTLAFALPLIPHYLGFAFLTGSDKIMIRYMVGDEKAGIYSLAAILSTVESLLWQALCVSITPFIYERLGQRRFREIQEALKPVLVLIGICCILISLAAPEMIRLLSPEEYLEGVHVVPAVSAGVFMHVLYDIFSNIAFFHKKSVAIMGATATAATVNLLLNYVCIAQFGYLAAGYTTLVSFILLAVLHYAISRRLERERIFDVGFSVIASAIVVIGCLLCEQVYAGCLLRYGLILAILAVLFWKRGYFIDAISNMGV